MSLQRTPECPTDLALESHLLTPDRQVGFHLGVCPRCARWMEAARVAETAFARRAPELLAPARRALEGGGLAATLRWVVPAVALVAASLVAVVLRPSDSPRYQVKGSEWTVYVRHGEQVRAVEDGARVLPGDALRFHVSPSQPGSFVWVVSVDGSGRVSRLAPAEGDVPLQLEAATTLPGSAVLDDAQGPERLYLFLSERPVPWSQMERSLTEALGPSVDHDQVRRGPVPKLEGLRHQTLLLERGGP
jgi:hypothetical protein